MDAMGGDFAYPVILGDYNRPGTLKQRFFDGCLVKQHFYM